MLIVGILTFMSRIIIVLSWVEYEKRFLTAGLTNLHLTKHHDFTCTDSVALYAKYHIKQILLPDEQTHFNDCLRPWTIGETFYNDVGVKKA